MRAKGGVVGTSRYARRRGGTDCGKGDGLLTVICDYDMNVAGIHRLFSFLRGWLGLTSSGGGGRLGGHPAHRRSPGSRNYHTVWKHSLLSVSLTSHHPVSY